MRQDLLMIRARIIWNVIKIGRIRSIDRWWRLIHFLASYSWAWLPIAEPVIWTRLCNGKTVCDLVDYSVLTQDFKNQLGRRALISRGRVPFSAPHVYIPQGYFVWYQEVFRLGWTLVVIWPDPCRKKVKKKDSI